MNLTNHFLIAVPGMMDGSFDQGIVYICEHNAQGALGLVVNKPVADITLSQLFERVDLTLPEGFENFPVYYGGPVQTERGFVLHDTPHAIRTKVGQPQLSAYTATLQVTAELEMTSSKDVLEAISTNNGPDRFLVTLGYAGWGQGQLEEEIAQNCWLNVQAKPELIFDVDAKDRYNQALALLGIAPYALVSIAGHA